MAEADAARADVFGLAPLSEVPAAQLLRGPDDAVGQFFLALALGFNDLKGLVFADETLKNLGAPPPAEVSPHAGQFFGMRVQIFRWMAGLVHEVIALIKKQESALASAELQELVRTLRKEHRDCWTMLVAVAKGHPGRATAESKLLVQIRNNVAFHYYDPKMLARGYANVFTSPNDERQRAAMVSLGPTMQATRFYFADAAAQAAMRAIGTGTINAEADERIALLAQIANQALAPLVEAFVRSRAALPR